MGSGLWGKIHKVGKVHKANDAVGVSLYEYRNKGLEGMFIWGIWYRLFGFSDVGVDEKCVNPAYRQAG